MYLSETAIDVIKIFALGAFSFLLAFWIAPFLICFLYRHKLWRKKVRTKSIDGKELIYFKKFHSKGEVSVPRFGGVLIWAIPLFLAALFFLLSKTDIWWFQKLNFLSREQTWLPFFALITASLVGLVDDFLQVKDLDSIKTNRDYQLSYNKWRDIIFSRINKLNKYIAGGLSLKIRLFLMALFGFIGGLWLFTRLGLSTLYLPGIGVFEIGFWYILLFIIVMLATYSGGVIDGLDGLSGGAFSFIFASFTAIALFYGQIDLAAFCAVVLGSLLAFLWFNIPPARFYMGETGMMGLCATLTVIAFLTDSVLVLPIIGFLLVIESGSVILQLLSKKFRKKKIFLAAPIHHHFQAMGWSVHQITMRFWIIGAVMAIIGAAIKILL